MSAHPGDKRAIVGEVARMRQKSFARVANDRALSCGVMRSGTEQVEGAFTVRVLADVKVMEDAHCSGYGEES